MYITNKSLYDRSLEKTPEQLFINSLRKEYELSPAESAGILELAKTEPVNRNETNNLIN